MNKEAQKLEATQSAARAATTNDYQK